jgi:hypothetical protein
LGTNTRLVVLFLRIFYYRMNVGSGNEGDD